MKNLQTIIQLLYKRVPAQKVLNNKVSYDKFDKNEFIRMTTAYLFHYSEDESRNLLNYFLDEFYESARREGRRITRDLNVFEPLFYYAKKFLIIHNNEILCDYSKLLEWRQMAVEISEDVVITAFLAAELTYSEVMGRGFSWKRVIGHNNAQINTLVRRGISENHSHLNGAAPIFSISWLSLMNNVNNSQFGSLLRSYDSERRYTNVAYTSVYEETSFYEKYMQAVLIRLFLYSRLTGKRIKIGTYNIDLTSIKGMLSIPAFYLNKRTDEEYLYENKIIQILTVLKQTKSGNYLFRQIVLSIIKEYLNHDDEQFKSICKLNFKFFMILDGPIGEFLIDIKQVNTLLQSISAVSLSDLFLQLLFLAKKVSLEDIQELFCNTDEFQKLWENYTLKNVKVLLQNPQDIIREANNIQSTIDVFRLEYFKNEDRERSMDYLLNGLSYGSSDMEKSNFVFSGERWLMYIMLRKIYSNESKDSDCFNLFYAYLLIKESIRSELVQSNQNVGFKNFRRYERRKGDLLADKIYRNEFTRLAVSDSLFSGNMRKIELRIAPKSSIVENSLMIQQLDKLILPNNAWKKKLFYTVHFIKSVDDNILDREYVYCRHYMKRKEIMQKAYALIGLRELYPYVGERVLGIDAASSEIGCRPEVFASAFRYLKNHRYSYETYKGTKKMPQLNATYHVGEDFLDPVDGLRAIEESVLFLNLCSGDRLGHALALGIDVSEWYQTKGNRIALPIQDYLDNIVWIYHKMLEYNIKGFENFMVTIKNLYSEVFGKIYGSNIVKLEVEAIIKKVGKTDCSVELDFDIFNYYNAWKLRGDDPEIYDEGFYDENKATERLEYFRVNFKYPSDFEIRRVQEVALIYYMYHYNYKIRQAGKRIIEAVITRDYTEAVTAIQKALQRDIARRGIAIETNPSSNFLIGTFRQYQKHPIFKFYNKGLINDIGQVNECPQLLVSINTDDQGVFSTSLENEYALVASALESITDENGIPLYNKANIYEWLDKIRIMGNDQSFGNIVEDNKGKEIKKLWIIKRNVKN